MSKPTILCVDDELNMLIALRTQLSQHFPDCTIEIAESADEALELVDELYAEGIAVPLVITDQTMPGIRGDEFLIQLHASHPEILKVMLTGQTSMEDLVNVVNRGGLYRFIAKPWHEIDLTLTVTEALRCYQQGQQLAQQQTKLEQANRDLAALNAELEKRLQDQSRQLRWSEQNLRLFVRNTPIAVAMFDRHMTYLLASQKWKSDYRLVGQAIIGRSHEDVLPNLSETWQMACQRGLAGEPQRSERDIYQHANGDREWVRWEIRPWYDTTSKIGGIIVFSEVITDRIHIEQALQESEQRYITLTEAAPVGIFRNDIHGNLIYANRRWQEITSLSLEEGLGSGWIACIHPDCRDRCLRYWEQIVQEGCQDSIETCLQMPDGSLKWVYCQAQPEKNTAGTVIGYVGTLTDITSFKQTEIFLRQNESRLAEAQRIAHLGNWEFDLTTQKVIWSEEMFQIAGLDPDQTEPTYADFQRMIHPEDWPSLEAAIGRAIGTGTPYKVEHRIIRPDGSIRYLMGRGEAVLNAQGQVIKLVGTGQDQTEVKQVTLALQDSEEQNRAILSAIPDLMMVISADGKYLRYSYSQLIDEIVPLHPNPVGLFLSDVLQPELASHFLASIQQVLDTRTMQTFEQQVQFEDGFHWEEVRIVPYQADKVLCMIRDLNDRKQAENALRQSEAKLKALISALPDLIMHIDRNGVYLDFFTTSTFRVLKTQPEIVGTKVYETLPPDLAQRRMDAIDAALKTGNLQVYEQELEINGIVQTEECRVVVCDEHEVLVIGRDISDRKRLETELRQREAFLNSIFTGAEVAISVVDVEPDHTIRFVDFNPVCETMSGVNSDFLRGKTLTELAPFFAPADLEITTTRYQTCITTGEMVQFEVALNTPDGEQWWLTRQSPLKDETGRVYRIISTSLPITDRRRAELALAAIESQQRSILESVPSFIINLDRSGRILFVNRLTPGLPLEDVIGKHMDEFVTPASQPIQRAALAQVLTTGETVTIETQGFRPDGGLADYDVRLAPVEANGQIGSVILVATDITERKQAEVALQASEERYRLLSEISPVGIFRNNLQGACIYANPKTLEITGLPLTDNLGDGWGQNLHPEDRDRMYAAWTEFVAQTKLGQIIRYAEEHRYLYADGTLKWGFAQAVPERNAAGELVGFIGSVIDISERKQSEISLREREQQVISLLNNIPHIAWLKDSNGRFLAVNEPFGQACGYAPSQLVGLTDLDVWPHDLAEAYRRDDAEVMQSRQQKRVEERLMTSTGVEQWLETIKTPIFNGQGEASGTVGIAMDITNRKQYEQTLQQLNMDLERRVQQRTEDLQQAYNQLRDSEARFQSFMDNSPTASWITDANGVMVYMSRNYQQIFYFSCMDVLGKSVMELYPADIAQQFVDNIQTVVTTNQVLETIEVAPRRDGSLGDFLVYKFPIVESSGQILVGGVAIDITDRKAAELALAESEAKFRRLVEGANDLIWSASADSAFTYLSPQFKTLFGFEVSEWIGQSLAPLIHPEDQPAVASFAQQIFERGIQGVGQEFRHLCSNGNYRWVTVNSTPVKDSDGKVIGLQGILQDITDRKQAEQQLRAEQLRLQVALEAANMGTWESSMETGFWSERTEAIFGYAPGSFPGDRESFLRLVYSEDQEQVFAALAHSFATRSPYNVEYRINRLDGELRWVAVNGKVVETEDGSGLRIIGVVLDITDRKQAETALRNSEAQLRATFEQAAVGIGQADLTGRFVQVNQKLCDIVGYSEAEMLRKSYFEITHPDDLELDRVQVEQLFSDNVSTFITEKRYIRSDGTIVWTNLSISLLRDATGAPQHVLGFVQDISDRKQAVQALQESRNMLKLVLDTIPQRVFWKDRNFRFLGCNPAFANDYQLTHEDIVGKTDLELPWAEWAPLYQADDNLVMQTGLPKLNYEEPTVNFHGEPIWIRSSKIPLTNVQGEVIGILGAYDDISDRKRLESELRQINTDLENRVQERTLDLQRAMEAAEAANQAKSTFLANMSHELRTPLNAILGFAQLMTRDTTLESVQRNQLGIINRSGEHLLSLINDILEMSKIEAGQTILKVTSFNFHHLLGNLEEMLYLKAQHKGLQLVFDLASNLPSNLQTDESKLRQVLINLLGNAIKFTDRGTVTLRVHSELKTQNSKLTLHFEVEDTGHGISPEELPTLFEPFIQTASGRRTQEGTGLGLPISRQFVQLMGGDITVTSVLHQGSIFHFSIQAEATSASTVQPRANQCRVVGLVPNQPTYRILVVEDVPVNRDLLVALLESVGFSVQMAGNGQEAVTWWQNWHPHLIWMDIRMPVMDGYEATRRIRTLESAVSHVPSDDRPQTTVIIALTASAFEEERNRMIEIGCDDFVRKPFQEGTLFEKMAEYLGVQYIYEEITQSATERSLPGEGAEISVLKMSDLTVMSIDWLTQLREAVIQVDADRALALIDQISLAQYPIAQALQQKIDNFDFEDMMLLLDQAIAASL